MKKFFLGMESELYIIEETAKGYVGTSHLEGTQPVRVAVDPQNQDRIYCATYGHGLWKSEDGGAHWKAIGKVSPYHEAPAGDGIRSAHLTFVAVHPYRKRNGNSVVYAGTEPAALYCSEDNGEHWKEFKDIQTLPSKNNWQFPPRPYTHHIRWVTPSYADENKLGVSVEFGAFIRTEDHGATWQDRPFQSPLDTHVLLAHPHAPGRLYAACGDGLISQGNSYAESNDDGETWEYKSEGLEAHPYLYNMTLHPEDSNDRLAAASKHAREAHHSSLYSTIYRKQGSEPWRELSEGLPCEGAFIHVLAADPIEAGTFYAMNNYGLYQWKKGTSKWKKIEVNWKEKFLNEHPSALVIRG
ncbi:hypothetical protein SAMN05192534_11089 [Alteribacillus persepolensis]|uniref:Glycosyl hydrolase n=1 Tax=Alteribacillus persepolensis TaxID=568899 RepID=A0A1G8EVY7_9BACI|nr:sialidase family protein [Alteribacillus persepolensis]SDH74000.1 hypothetical protein SAMN05192534_11089 [Alteribacillus persepolensis]